MAAAGYAAFSLAMAAGRFAGDYLSHRFGAVAVVRAGGLASAAGILAAVVAGDPLVAVAGFGLAGLGFSIVFPNALSAAGRTRGLPAGASIAAVSTMGYTGFLAGPPIIGLVSQATSLSFGLITVLGASLAIAALAGALSVVRPLEHAHEAPSASGT
jgi:MFS family permease